ncbi:hypothetical protein [Streptomyces sp. NPDC049555]|uniref:hypothetical protein n=1 Tax=Streptomyces sp. NPDC049555 TaxID=3154930 RepID=UPI003425BE66
MPDVDFYAHVATHGKVLGAGIGSGPAEWEAALGPDHLDDRSEGLLRRDYGLVELSFRQEGDAWPCFAVSVQVHRLLQGGTSVPQPLQDAYGPFAGRLRFDELSAAIAGLGHGVEPDDDGTATDVRRYWVSGSGARIHVVADVDPYGYGDVDPDDPTEPRVGDVRSIGFSPDWWSAQ